VFSDHVLHTVLEEAVERGNLLGDETVLLKVRVYHGPRVLVFDFSTQELLLRLGVHCLLIVHHIYIL
jgi:hypothetical protein